MDWEAQEDYYNNFHFDADHQDDGHDSYFWRFLAGKKTEPVRIDYSVLSVAVMTLGLIMVVEVARHKLDHVVHHRQFGKAVVEGVYTELATLGIVEFLLHVMAEYYEEYDKAKKQVFADVHFLLFYTAILNALQSVLLYHVSSKVSKRLWVKTETLDLSSYVEIREEFDQVKKKLDQLHHRRNQNNNGDPEANLRIQHDDEQAEDFFHLDKDCISRTWQSVVDRIRYPALKKKHKNLLLQIRFHEIRVHFLQSNNLPLRFKVSDYLVRSEQNVLLKLVQVSPIAWLLLTGVINLFYYLLGIASYKVQNTELIGTAMIWIFFWIISLFVVLSWLVSNKMKSVFRTIMHTDSLWSVAAEGVVRDRMAQKQKSLFWGHDPKLVIAAVQFMQFGYAVAVSTVIVFWEEISDGSLTMAVYPFAIAICYAVFVHVTSRVIPKYTLCTSLAQLVDERCLHETVAVYRLEEAKQREQEARDEPEIAKFLMDEGSLTTTQHGDAASLAGNSSVSSGQRGARTPAELMVELVKTDTGALRTTLPDSVKARLEEREKKRARIKQSSDGVTAMRRLARTTDDIDLFSSGTLTMTTVSQASPSESDEVLVDEYGLQEPPRITPGQSRTRVTRRKARSEGVLMMAEGFEVSGIPEHKEVHISGDAGFNISGHGNNVDDASVSSDSSAYSDADDVPDVKKEKAIARPKRSLKERFHDYFITKRYVVVSNVFGTMFAFFFVGQRVESFLHSENIASVKFTHFDFAHDYIFWLLTAWLGFFICGACLIFYALNPANSMKEKKVLVGGILDFILCSGCLIIFFVAEVQRCCIPNDNERLLAEKGYEAYDSSEPEPEPVPCSCPRFGTRQYGGLGMIEPFTCLIALRIFRFWAAKRILLFVASWRSPENLPNRELLQQHQSLRMNPFDVFANTERPDKDAEDDHGDGHGHGHGHAEETGTMAELWQEAVCRHPDIVAKHGEFSGELLRVMLGLHLTSEDGSSSTFAGSYSDADLKKTRKVSSSSAPLKHTSDERVTKPLGQKQIAGSSYVETPTPVRSALSFELSPRNDLLSDSLFVSPNARLLRSMRRCDKKMLPVLDHWTVVDVALTRYEIVFFDAAGADAKLNDGSIEGSRQASANDALISTKGGKGLRLSDVAFGRRLVGHIPLSHVKTVHVERTLPGDAFPIERANMEVNRSEFWKVSQSPNKGNATTGLRWDGTVAQDVLRISQLNETVLMLRFYSDLEAKPRTDEAVFKNNAFQWAQTAGRICGKVQLKQYLPHFGDGTSNELWDYLIETDGSSIIPGPRQTIAKSFYERTEL